MFEGTERQFETREGLLSELDPLSFEVFLRKAAGRVAAQNGDRGWTQLVESINEVRGYSYARSLGYRDCQLLDERSYPFPDIEASNPAGQWCVMEVKTIQESDEELELRGQVQKGEPGLPIRLTRLLRRRYRHGLKQVTAHPRASEAERICFMIANLDLRTLLARENQRLLPDFLRALETNAKIHCISQHRPAEPIAPNRSLA